MEDNIFWIRVWAIMGTVVIALATMICLCDIYDNTMRSRLARQPDPMAAVCAYASDRFYLNKCAIYLSKK